MSDTVSIEIPAVLGHIRRESLPWVPLEREVTECGRPVTELKSVLSRDEAVALAKQLGPNSRKLLYLHLCEVCVDTANRNPRSFVALFERRYHAAQYSHTRNRDALLAELEAIELVLTENAERIRQFADARGAVVDLKEVRRARR